jgi:hypothetical protein
MLRFVPGRALTKVGRAVRQNGDTMPGINSSFMDVAARLGKPLAFEPEFGMDNISDLAHDVLSWGYWNYTPAASLAPAVSSYKFVENRCENNYVQTMGVQLFLLFAFPSLSWQDDRFHIEKLGRSRTKRAPMFRRHMVHISERWAGGAGSRMDGIQHA